VALVDDEILQGMLAEDTLVKKAETSREAAQEIAEAALPADCDGVSAVYELYEIPSAPPRLYNVDLNEAWIAYCIPRELRGLQSSTIVVIDRHTGAVRYVGSANDEG